MCYLIKIGVYGTYIFLVAVLFSVCQAVAAAERFDGIAVKITSVLVLFIVILIMACIVPKVEKILHNKYVKKKKIKRKPSFN